MFIWRQVVNDKERVFHSPYSLEECVQKLIARSERDTALPWYRQSQDDLLVSVEQLDLDTYQFKMQKHVIDAIPFTRRSHRRSSGFYVELTGSLEKSQSETIVRSQARLGAFTRRFAAVWLTFWITSLGCGIVSRITRIDDEFWFLILGLIVGVGAMSWMLKWAVDARNDFSHLPNEILGNSPS